MTTRIVFFYLVLSLFVTATPAPADTLDTLKPAHPRVLATDDDFSRIGELVKSDELAGQWYDKLKARGEEMLDEPVTTYNIRDGRRLLYESRMVSERVQTLGMLDRLSPDDRYRDRIWADLEAAAGFKDWHPDHFLDVAEMAFAFGIAYDWLYNRWTPEQRTVIREAIIRHGLQPGLSAYKRGVWWTRTHINWSQVCNGGLMTAALAIADEEPELASRMIELGVEALKKPMSRYAPDGGYEEGPGYWAYGTVYNVIALAALESALGTDFGLADAPGFSETASFPQHMTGPTGNIYNFGDNRAKSVRSPATFYLAGRFNQPGNAYAATRHARGSALDLLWYDPAGVDPDAADLPLDALYKSAGAASMRSAWHDPDAWFVGAKGGWLGFGHAQMDLGSFILERHGVRWLVDLGSDNYNLPGYFHSDKGGRRWDYYRNRAEGHNTLVVNPPGKQGDQPYEAQAGIALKDKTITIDLSEVYGGDAQRRIALDTKSDLVTVSDRIAFDEPVALWWFAHTQAKVTLTGNGRSARLEREGKAMDVVIVSPKEARFKVMDARPLPGSPDPRGQNPNSGAELINKAPGSRHTRRGDAPAFGDPDPDRGVRKLAIHLEDVTRTEIVVRFRPVVR